jgi:hydroxylamine reductase
VKSIGESETFAQVIEHAKKLKGFEADEAKHSYTMTGFAKDWFLSHSNVEKMVDEIAKGQVKHIYVIGGSDGHTTGGRSHFKDFADGTSADSLITLGDIKYRFNKQFKGSTTEKNNSFSVALSFSFLVSFLCLFSFLSFFFLLLN